MVVDVCECGGGGCIYGVAVVGNHLSNLHCVVVFSRWRWYAYANVTVVVVVIGWLLSTHWHTYCTCNPATCSVVFFGGGGRFMYVIVMEVVVGLFHPLQHVSVALFFSPISAEAVLTLKQIALFGGGRCMLMR